jgi:hypothetical protein
MLWTASLALAAVGLASPANCEALQGCQGPPSSPAVLAKPTLVFVWPCFAHADTFLEEDPREDERTLDRKMQAQYVRLREKVAAAGMDVLKGSGAQHIDFTSPNGKAERIRTTTVQWRGVFAFCPGRKVKRISMAKSLVPDSEVLDAVRYCLP